MYSIYSLLLTLGFLLMSPLFLLRREKYASGFKQRLGNYPQFIHDGRKVIWLHCVSVGETNAARPLVDQLRDAFPDHRLVISTTTKTGQELAQKIFAGKADAIVYFPFDWKFSVRRALGNYKPSLVLLMETEIWPRFIREAKRNGANISIVNGRLSERSCRRYSRLRSIMRTVLADIDLALMQAELDTKRILKLGISENRSHVTGNLKFDISDSEVDASLVEDFVRRFGIDDRVFTIIAASTHQTEETLILEAYSKVYSLNSATKFKLIIAPRHPERFANVADLCRVFCTKERLKFGQRSDLLQPNDPEADIILMDSIGELRSIYSIANIVIVGGSFIPHGGQSVLEPASLGKPILIGPHTHNFDEVIRVFLENKALVQGDDSGFPHSKWLSSEIDSLFRFEERRDRLSTNARRVMNEHRGATERTVGFLKPLLDPKTGS